MENRFNTLAKQWDSKPQRVESAMIFVDYILKNYNKDISLATTLDYGCGSGLVSFGLANKAKKVIGYDNSTGMIDVYNQKVENIGFKNITSKLHDINKEDIKSNQFDLIVTNMTMHHIQDTNMFIKKLVNGLKTDGELFIADLSIEDGTFHSDNTGVEHFGFKSNDIQQLFINYGLKNISIEILTTINKTMKSYDIFVIKGTK